ncbi:MAG: LacI family DNA-binding transcriptional regulator [Lentisphaeria bacterium]|nr:LacI family DNA-binding transcriptional regulator [Lentisphaeria bacterium]
MGKGIYIRKKKITLKDVAREAGCSVTAVSFVINRTHSISEELQKKVYKAIEKLNYHPYGCHELPPRRWIALITQGNANIYEVWLKAIHKYGYFCRNCCIPQEIRDKGLLPILGNIAKDPQLAGIINLHSFIHSVDLLRRCKGIPSVIFSREGSMLSDVTLPFAEFGKLAAQILLERGHRKVGMVYFSSCCNQEPKLRLYNAFNETFAKSGVVENLPIDGEKNYAEQLYPLMERAFQNKVTAFFVPEGRGLPDTLLRWAYQKRLFIPDDFSLLVQEMDNFSSNFVPPLSTIGWPLESMADATMKTLADRIEGKPVQNIVFHPVFKDAGSVAFLQNK